VSSTHSVSNQNIKRVKHLDCVNNIFCVKSGDKAYQALSPVSSTQNFVNPGDKACQTLRPVSSHSVSIQEIKRIKHSFCVNPDLYVVKNNLCLPAKKKEKSRVNGNSTPITINPGDKACQALRPVSIQEIKRVKHSFCVNPGDKA